MLCFMCSPLAGVQFCSQFMTRYIEKASFTFLIDWINTIANYMVGISTITAYAILVSVLLIRGTIRLRSNTELKMMIQIAVMSTIGVFYFFYWEFHHSLNIDLASSTIIYENLTLFYYDAVVLPYLLLNNTFGQRFLATFHKSGLRCSAKSLVRRNVFFLTGARVDCLGKGIGSPQ
ncbi:hypothetical protein RB195_013031 [Necator americanus]|uniref:Serpentine receptor class gamma n=1 Tax=Necator americanus TaxID=51031 RepID=A0ABR1DUE1_NECAM